MWKRKARGRWGTLSAAEQAALVAQNQARLGTRWQERQRTWDERCGDYGPALPLLPVVCTGGIVLVVVGIVMLVSWWYAH